MILRRLINLAVPFVLTISLFCLTFSASAQTSGLDVSGSVKEAWKGLDGTILTLYKNGSVDQSLTTSSNGKFNFFFEANATYMLDVSKPGYVTKKIAFNTEVPADISMVWDFDFIVELFQDQSGLDKAIFINPVAKVQYSERYNEFDYDLDYSMEFQKQEEEVFAELEQMQEDKYKEEEKLRTEAEKLVKEQVKDLAAAQKTEQDAEKKRLAAEAKQRKEAEADAKRIAEEQKTKGEAEEKAKENQYAALITEADKLAQDELFTEAKAKLDQASRIFPDKNDLNEKLADMDRSIAKVKIEQEERKNRISQFDELMVQAEELESKEKFEAAITLYKMAADLNPDSEMPIFKMNELTKKINELVRIEQEKREKREQFDVLFADAKKSEEVKDYEKAKNFFSQATELLPEENEPKERIQAIDKILEQLAGERKKEEEINTKYVEFIANGDQLVASQKLIEAKAKYQEAIALRPEEKTALDKLAQIKGLIAEAANKETELAQEQEDFAKLISEGGKLQSASEFENAEKKFQEALKLNVDNEAANQRIASLAKQLEEIARKKKEEEQYNSHIQKGLTFLEKDQFDLATMEFKTAAAMKPGAAEPNKHINAIQARIDQLAVEQAERKKNEEALARIMESADDLFRQKDYEASKTNYLTAQVINPDDKLISKRLKEINRLLVEKAEAEVKRLAKEEEERKAAEELAKFEEEMRLAAEVQLKAEAERRKIEEEKRREEEAKAELAEDAELARKAEEKRLKEEAETAALQEAERLRELAKAKADEEERLRMEAENEAVLLAEQAVQQAAELAKSEKEAQKVRLAEQNKLEQEEKAKLAAAEKARLEEEERLSEEAELAAAVELKQKAKLAKAKIEEEKRKAKEAKGVEKAEAEKAKVEEARLAAERKAVEEADREAKRLAEEAVKLETEKEQVRLAELQKLQQEEKDRLEAEEQFRLAEEVRLSEEARLRAEDEARKEAELANAKSEENRLKAEAQARLKTEQKRLLVEEAARLVKEEEEKQLAQVRQAEGERRALLAKQQEMKAEARTQLAQQAKAKQQAARELELEFEAVLEAERQKAIELAEAKRKAEEEDLRKKRKSEIEARAQKAEQERLQLAAIQTSQIEIEADILAKEAEAILEREMFEREARMKAEIEAKVKTEMQLEFEDELRQKEIVNQAELAVEAEFKRQEELKLRKKEQNRQQKIAMMESRKRQELEAWEAREEETARKQEERITAEKANEKKLEQERLEHEAEMAHNSEVAKIAAERNAEKAADLERRRLRDEADKARKSVLAAEWNQMRESAEAERKQKQKELDAAKIAKAAKEKAALDQQRIQEKQIREDEIAQSSQYANERDILDKKLRLEREQKRNKEIAQKKENFLSKNEFEKKAKELAQSAVDSDRDSYEAEVRAKMKAEYAAKRETIAAKEVQKPKTTFKEKPNQFQIDLAERYAMGVSEESEIMGNREIQRLIVKRKEDTANQYSRVKWNWGGVYYFKNEQSTSKQVFDQETEW
jgi:hypothetical protein